MKAVGWSEASSEADREPGAAPSVDVCHSQTVVTSHTAHSSTIHLLTTAIVKA